MLRLLAGLALIASLVALPVRAQDEKPDPLALRYGVEFSPESYPQKTPEEAVKSIVKALDGKRIDYLLAQLADPKFVDGRVAEYRMTLPPGREAARTFVAFDRLVSETRQHLLDDPQLLRELRLFAREAAFEMTDTGAVGSAKAVPARKVYFRKLGERWFLENRQQ